MLITTTYRSSLNFGGVTYTVLDLTPLQMVKLLNFTFPFSNLSLPQLNVMKLIQNAYYHKTQIRFEFWWRHLYRLELCPFTNGKTAEIYVSVL